MIQPVVFLFVDDEERILSALGRWLKSHAERILPVCVTSADHALEVLATQRIDVVVTDYRMPGLDGLAFLRRLKCEHPTIVRLVISANIDGHARSEISEIGVAHVVEKPWHGSELMDLLEDVARAVNADRDRGRDPGDGPA